MQVNLQKRENIQTTILALLLTHKGGCTLKQLVSDYYDLEGEHIPWRDLGYASLLSFLSSMSKTVQVEKENNTIIVKGIASEKSKHVSKLVGNQKCQKPPVKRKSYKPSHYFPKTAPPRVLIPAEILRKIIDLVNEHPDGVNKYYVLQEIQACMSFVNISMEEMEEQLRELSHQIFQSNNKIYPIHSDKAKYSDCLKKDNNMYSESKLTTQNEEKCDSVIVTVAGNESTDNILDYDEEDIFDFVPSTCTGYLNQTKSVTKIKPTANFIQETVSKCQDQVAEHTLLNCSYKDSTWNQIEHNTNVKKDKEDGEILINERVKFRLEKLIQNQPDGLWCAELPEKYLEEYKVPLNYTELGFNSVREFTSQLPEIFHCIQFCDSGDFKLYYAKREKPSNKTKQTYKTNNLMELHHIYEASNEEPLPAEVSLNTCKILIPDDVLTIGENVGYINVAHLAQNVEPFVEVVVVEVFTPSFFWIQLRKSKKIFKSFMDDLNNFYSTKCEQYVIPLVTLEKGLHCACMYNGVWHRGVIKTVKPDFQITIMFYDYGTLKTYPPEAVYYLHRMFSNLPAQAIPCGLINVRPRKGSKWSRSATLKFAMRTSEIPLIATIASINTEDNSMMVSLTDTLEEEDIHINDWLVEQKLAVHGKMVCMKKRNFLFRYYLESQERLKQQEYNKLETNSRNKAAMYNLNSNAILSHKNNYNKTSSSKKESLYEQLSLKLKSIKNSIKVNDNNNEIKVHVENEILSNSSLVSLSKKYESCEEYVELCHDYLKSSSNIKSNTSCAAKITNFLSCNVRDDDERNDSSDNKCDIIKTYNNIPGQYANYFRVQEPDEQDIGCTETSTDSLNEKQQIKYIDCSVIWNNAMREKEIITQKNELKVPCKMTFRNRDNVPLGENCFLKAVSNSSHFALRDKDIHWTPTGNINKMQDVSPLILKNLERRKKYFANDIVIGIPQSILEVLTGENVNEVQSSNSLHEVSEISTDNVKCPNTIELHDTKNFLNDSDNGGNFYMGNINTKALAPKLKLLQKILTAKGMSSSTSSLDSDDLSSLEKSILSDYDIDSDNMKFKEDEHESAININRDKSNISYSDSEFECLSSSMEIDAVDLHVQETVKPTTNDIEVYNDKESVSMESDLIKETDIASEIETNEVQMNAQVNELISSYKVTDASSILVFNDIGIESDEEEWDIQVSYADVHNFMKSSFSFNENIQDQLDHKETDSRLEIVEINDSNSIEIENVDAYKVISPDRVINDKVCLNVNKTENLVNPNQISEIHLTGKDSEKSSEISNKYASYLENVVSYKRQGKSKSLAEMLQKVKLLRKNC